MNRLQGKWLCYIKVTYTISLLLFISVAGCKAKAVDGFITSMDATITTTFWYDHPNVTFDCRIHKKNFKDCEYYRIYM